jgi:hypothetical protein
MLRKQELSCRHSEWVLKALQWFETKQNKKMFREEL